MKFLNRRGILLLTILLIAAIALGCQGSGNPTSLPESSAPPVVEDGPPLMPGFPGNEDVESTNRIVAQQDNIQAGKDVWRPSAGTSVVGETLVMSSAVGGVAWGVWRWGAFQTGIGVIPIDLELDVTPTVQGRFWLLLANYDTMRWEVLGPQTGLVTLFPYAAGINYVSETKNAYVALVVEGGHGLGVNELNLRAHADVDPPAAPTNLTITLIRSTEIEMTWDHVSDTDLWRYNIYRSRSPAFNIGDEGAYNIGQTEKNVNEFTATTLEPDTTYYFRVTALDVAQNESAASNVATGKTLLTDPCVPPTNLTVNDVSGSWADLSWTASTSPDLLGYDVYTHPTDPDFEVGEPGVTWQNEGLGFIHGTSERITGLEGETHYYCRMRSTCMSGKSALSNTTEFTTTSSVPPVPDFDYSPLLPQAGSLTYFDPSATTDIDTDIEELEFSWDYENDGNVDETTTGPDTVSHVYASRGPITVKLTVSDGTPVSTTKDFVVGFRYSYDRTGASKGYPVQVVAADSDPGSSRAAVLALASNEYSLRLYSGGSWQTIALDEITDYVSLADVAVTATGLYVLALKALESNWNIRPFSYAGGHWTEVDSIPVTRNAGFENGRLNVSSNGRLGFSVVGVTGHASSPPDFDLLVWHEKADTTYRTGSQNIGTGSYSPVDIVRNDSTSYVIYSESSQIKQWSFTDSADTDQNMQAVTGTPLFTLAGNNPSADSNVHWTCAFDNSRVYYGDNYGTANGASQYYATSSNSTGLLGVGPVGDNEGLFAWTVKDANEVQYLRCRDTTANAGAGLTYEIASDAGIANGGSGYYFSEDTDDGIYAVASEERDGEVTGYFIVDGVASETTVRSPSGDENIEQRHQALVLNGAVLGLHQQRYPTALSSYASSAGQPYTTDYIGLDNWLIPEAACMTSVADEYFAAGYTELDGGLIVNLYNWGTAEGTQELYVAGTSMVNLEHNSVDDSVILCYTTNSAQDIVVHDWNGAAWSGATTAYDGSTTIEAITLRHNADGDWGLVFINASDEVRLVEAPGGTWGASTLLSSEAVNGVAGIGLAYNSSNDLCVTVERDDATPGLYLGIKPAAGSISWELVVVTDGADTLSNYVFYHLADPLLLYYNWTGTYDDSRMHTVEMLGGGWYNLEHAFHMHGKPVDAILDPATNNIIMAGYSRLGAIRKAVVAILYP